MRSMINLLPMSYRREQLLRIRVLQWATITCTVLAIGWFWHWVERHEARVLAQELQLLEREHVPHRTMLKQLIQMRDQLNDLQHQETVARELEYHRNALTLLGVISDAVQARKGRVRMTKLELTGFQKIVSGEPTDEKSDPQGLTVSGVSLDNPAVAEMIVGLTNSGIFSRVELLQLKERNEADVSLRDFEVRCTF